MRRVVAATVPFVLISASVPSGVIGPAAFAAVGGGGITAAGHPAPQAQVHLVQPGDNLTRLSRRYGVSVESLRAANGLRDPNHVRIGTRLRIPGSSRGGGGGGAAGTVHRVRPGENLTTIARRYGVTVEALRRANGLSNPNHVVSGRRLQVPAGGAPRSSGGVTTHVVRRGESLSVIAARYGVATSTLQALNGIPNPNLVYAGRRLSVPSGGAEVRSARSVGVPSSRANLRGVFERYAAQHGVPADLAMAIGWQESGWQAHRVSSAGAVGVMQLMPDTVDFVSKILLRQRTRLNPYDAEQNIRMGTRFLRYLIDQTGNERTALHAWFQGLRSVRERGASPASQRFAANVLALRPRFR
jgi:LysM repeat protein